MLLHNLPQHIIFFLCPFASCWSCAFLLRSRTSQQRIDRLCRIRRKTFASLKLKVILLLITIIRPIKGVQRKAIHWAVFLRLLSSQQVPPYQQRRTVYLKETHLMHLKKKEITKKRSMRHSILYLVLFFPRHPCTNDCCPLQFKVTSRSR